MYATRCRMANRRFCHGMVLEYLLDLSHIALGPIIQRDLAGSLYRDALHYTMTMILRFRHKGLEAFFYTGSLRGIPVQPFQEDRKYLEGAHCGTGSVGTKSAWIQSSSIERQAGRPLVHNCQW